MTATKAEIAAGMGTTEDGLDVIALEADERALAGYVTFATATAATLAQAGSDAVTAVTAARDALAMAREGVATSDSGTPGADARAVAVAQLAAADEALRVYKVAARDARNALNRYGE